MGARVHIDTLPGYLPRLTDNNLGSVFRENAVALVGAEEWREPSFSAGSTDMGDVSHIMPALEAQAGGARGTGHGTDYAIEDPETSYILPPKAAAATIIDLLVDGAAKAKNILNAHKPALSKQAYLEFMRKVSKKEVWPI